MGWAGGCGVGFFLTAITRSRFRGISRAFPASPLCVTRVSPVHPTSVIRATTVRHPCITRTSPVHHPYVTRASPVCQPCITRAAPVHHPCAAHATPVCHQCNTHASPTCHPCVTRSPHRKLTYCRMYCGSVRQPLLSSPFSKILRATSFSRDRRHSMPAAAAYTCHGQVGLRRARMNSCVYFAGGVRWVTWGERVRVGG